MRRLVSESLALARVSSIALATIVLSAITAMTILARPQPLIPARVVAPDYKTLPVYFEENRGQTDPRVRFLARGRGYTIFLTGQGSVLTLRQPAASRRPAAKSSTSPRTEVNFTTASVTMNLVGARPDAQVEGIDPLLGRVNYFIGNDPAKWRSGVRTYARVKYRSVYQGIDLVYYGSPQALEYDLITAPGADPGAIKIEFQGADNMRLDKAGDLVIGTAAGNLTMRKPRVYQDTGSGAQREIGGRFVLSGQSRVGFQVASYDHSKALVIDPVLFLAYSTYLGGSINDAGFAIAVDSHGSAYATGKAQSADFPTKNAFQSSRKKAGNAFVTKFSADGRSLVYSTYLGGSGAGFGDGGTGIAVDSSGSAYVTGATDSADFPTKNAFQSSPKSHTSAFVTKFSADGGSLIYSTYLGGSGAFPGDNAAGIAVDSSGSAYVTGSTNSADFPTKNPFQSSLKGSFRNAFVTKFSADGRSLVYSTYLGGSTQDMANAIAVDAGGSAYVTGSTNSADFPTKNPFQSSLKGSVTNGFVSKFSADGRSLVYSTYLGGSTGDIGAGIAVDAGGSAYVTGFTESADFPTKNPFQGVLKSTNGNAFVTKFSADGKSLVYSTYLGGTGISSCGPDQGAVGIAVDSGASAYVTGDTCSTNFPTKNAFQSSNKGNNTFVTKFSADGSSLIYSTYLGGSMIDNANGIAVDTSGSAYVCGATDSSDFPTKNAFQGTLRSTVAAGSNAFVTKLVFGSPPPTPTPSATRKPTPTPTRKITSTPTRTPAPTATPSAPHIASIPSVILVGGSFNIAGTNFTKGSVVNFFVATATGPMKAGVFTPRVQTPILLTVDVPAATTQGQGFASVQVINTDRDFTVSNVVSALLQGNAAAGIPTIQAVNGKGLAATSGDPSFATNNVETVVGQGTIVKLGGTGFDTAHGVAIDLFCACPATGGKVGPFFLNSGNAGLSSTLLTFPLPATGKPNSPPTGPGSFVVSNAGMSKAYTSRSNAVSVSIGGQITVTSVIQAGSLLTVNGTGFSTLTVINFFNQQGGAVVNLGGLAGGKPRLALGFVSDQQFTLPLPPAAAVGSNSYIQAFNPPYVPFTSSGTGPGGAFAIQPVSTPTTPKP